MKKQLLSVFLFVAVSATVMAQSKSSSAFNNGDNLFNFGIGIGSPFFGTGYTASLPINPSITFEHGVTDEISVGGQLSYASSKYSYAGFDGAYTFKESATYVGVRGSYHLNEAFDIPSNFDVYAGASLGYVIVSVSDNEGDSGAAASAAGFGAFAGGKYYFASNTAVYAEVGYQSLSFLNVGVSFKF